MIKSSNFGNEIEIISWNASYSSYEDPPFNAHPVISFVATPAFLRFSESNNNFIPVNVTGGTQYDGVWWGWVDHEQRPNFRKATGGKVFNITLNTFWRGYPNHKKKGAIQTVSGIVYPKYMSHVVSRGHPLH